MSSYAFAARVKAIDTAGPEMKRLSEKAAAAVKPEAKGLSEELDALALDVQNGRFSSSSANGPDYFDGVVGQWIDHVTSEAIYNGEEWQRAIADDAMAAGEDAAVGYHPVSQRLTRFLALMQQARELMGKSARGPIARKALGMPGMTGEADDGDEAAVGSVTVVAPRLRRYRAVLVRSVNEQAVVEFDALETDPQHEIAEAVAANVPASAWVRREERGCCGYTYLDKVEDIGPASGPVAVPAGGMKAISAPVGKAHSVTEIVAVTRLARPIASELSAFVQSEFPREGRGDFDYISDAMAARLLDGLDGFRQRAQAVKDEMEQMMANAIAYPRDPENDPDGDSSVGYMQQWSEEMDDVIARVDTYVAAINARQLGDNPGYRGDSV